MDNRSRPKFVIVSTNDNETYWQCYPIVKFAWEHIIGITPILVFIGERVPKSLSRIETNIIQISSKSHNSVFFAQNCRYVVPAFLNTNEPIITADIDIVPLSYRYFNFPNILDTKLTFFTYRDCLIEEDSQVAMCYNASTRNVWQRLLGAHISTTPLETLCKLEESCGEHDQIRGGKGWFFDQQFLYKSLVANKDISWEIWTDHESGFRRLDRSLGENNLEHLLKTDSLHTNNFTDFHMLMPYSNFNTLNNAIVYKALNK
jgi:hypothetical protein